MPITTNEQQYTRLRSYLNPYIKGPNCSAVLQALATSSAYLVNSVNAVNENLYITTAVGQYLDLRLAEFGISRPPSVGLSDDVFRQIGLQVKNRKQVRDLINNLLDIIFGDEFVKASNPARAREPYHLADNDNLLVNFDGFNTVNIQFIASEFQDIANATAQEVADAITAYLNGQGLRGTAIVKNDGVGNYVDILSDTIGPASSVTVLGGKAQNQLLFDAPVPAGGNMSTQWTLSLQPGGKIRFTWTGGANPQLGKVSEGNYVNIFGGGFASSANEGSYTITAAVGGASGTAYFEVENPLGTSGVVVQGTDNAVLFYNPVRKTVASNLSYAAVYQTEARMLQIFLPAATRVVRRNRIGSAHIHMASVIAQLPQGTNFPTSGAGDYFLLSTTGAAPNYYVWYNTGSNSDPAVAGFTGIEVTIAANESSVSIASKTVTALEANGFFYVEQDASDITVLSKGEILFTTVDPGTMHGSFFIDFDPNSNAPNQPGPYMYDTTQPFIVGSVSTTLSQTVDGASGRVISVNDSSEFPDQIGYIIFNYGSDNQEGPIPYIARPSNGTLLISPAYMVQKTHDVGSDVRLIPLKAPIVPAQNGTDYQFFLTDVVAGRVYAQQLIDQVAATGINIVYTILLPSDIGLGKWGTPYTENPIIWSDEL